MAATVTIEEHEALRAKYDALRFELEQLRKLVFGSRSERSAAIAAEGQLGLFADFPGETATATEMESISYERTRKKAHPGRHALPDHLPVRETVIEPEGNTDGLKKIGEEITETLEYTPASLVRLRTVRPKYAKAGGEGVLIAPLPERPLPKAVAEASLLSHILVSKYIDHLPFYRQARMFKRDFRWEPAPSTLSDWMAGCCRLLEPLYDRLKRKILASGYLQADESPIKVLEKEKRGSTHRGYHWVYHDPVGRLVLFDYRKGRGRNGPKELLSGYRGVLQCDGYTVYDKIGADPGIVLAGCLAHARRKFHESLDSDPRRAKWALARFADIYAGERKIKEADGYGPDARKVERTENILPIMEDIGEWIATESIKVLPKSPIGKAMAYFLNQWPKLRAIFDDGRVELDNNLIENAIRPLALGRKNYLFAGSHGAAQHAAMLYSFFGSCKMQGTNPMEWLTDTLERLPGHSVQRLEELLPGYRA
jgi:transposase